MTAAMQEEVKIMGKYESFHFSPENNRSILMPPAETEQTQRIVSADPGR